MLVASSLRFIDFDFATAGVPHSIIGVRLENVIAPFSSANKIGRRKAGVFCLPAGVVRWNDLVIPNTEQLEQALTHRFQQAEHVRIIQTYRLTQPPSRADLMMKGKIIKISVSMCVPGLDLGIAMQPAVKGSGNLTIEWEVWSEKTKALIKRETVERPFDFKNGDPRRSPDVLANAIADSAQSIFR